MGTSTSISMSMGISISMSMLMLVLVPIKTKPCFQGRSFLDRDSYLDFVDFYVARWRPAI
jgi:hypothetical protein